MTNIDTAARQRLEILLRDAERKLLDQLRTHGWTATIDVEMEQAGYIIISAERGGHHHRVALLYTSATDNAVYRQLAPLVEHIFFNGAPYMVKDFASGIDTPVGPVDHFHALLLKWNEASTEGKFAPVREDSEIVAQPSRHRVLLSEQPIEAIWLRLRQIQSVTLARKIIAERAQRENVQLDGGAVRSKAEGLAYTLRNASDYFLTASVRNVTQRVLNLYYGSPAFASAEMLASPQGPKTLAEIEHITTAGHGLFTVEGSSSGLEHLVVGIIASGFFARWMKAIGASLPTLPEKKARRYEDLSGLPAWSWLTVEQLFARIPEIADLFVDIFDTPPWWVMPTFDQAANVGPSLFAKTPRTDRTYIQFVDVSGRMTKEDIARLPGPISEIAPVSSEGPGRHFRAAISHADKDVCWDAIKVHNSPFQRSAVIFPIFEVVDDYRAICVALLYALSIVVRYRPSLSRRVQEGDLDHVRALIEAFLAVVERVLPEQFLEKVTGQRVFAKQPGSIF